MNFEKLKKGKRKKKTIGFEERKKERKKEKRKKER